MSIQADRIIAVRTGKTVYRDGETVLKVFNADYSKADILHEAHNLARMEETGLCVPKLIEVMKLDGKWTIRSQYIEGSTMQQLMEASPGRADEYMDEFIDIQSDIFSYEAPLLEGMHEKLHRKIRKSGLDESVRSKLHTKLSSMPVREKICHGDFNPTNIIISSDGSHAVIDWSHVTQGNMAADAANSYILFNLSGDYDAAERYLKRFTVKTGISARYVMAWIPIMAAARLEWAKSSESALLMEWIKSIDYE